MSHKKESQTYQSLLSEVELLVQEISSGRLDLDEMLTKVEKGYGIIQKMRTRLEEVKGKIDTLHAKNSEQESADSSEKDS